MHRASISAVPSLHESIKYKIKITGFALLRSCLDWIILDQRRFFFSGVHCTIDSSPCTVLYLTSVLSDPCNGLIEDPAPTEDPARKKYMYMYSTYTLYGCIMYGMLGRYYLLVSINFSF